MATNPKPKVVLVTGTKGAGVQPQIDALKNDVASLHSQMQESNGKLDALLAIIQRDLEAKLKQDETAIQSQHPNSDCSTSKQTQSLTTEPEASTSTSQPKPKAKASVTQVPEQESTSHSKPEASGVEAPTRMEVEASVKNQVKRAKRPASDDDVDDDFDRPLPEPPKKNKPVAKAKVSQDLSDEALGLMDAHSQSEYDQNDILELHASEDDMNDLLNQLDGVEEDLDVVNDGLARLVQGSYRRRLVPKLVVEFCDETPAPSNCTHLKVPDVNPPIWSCMSRDQRHNDLTCRSVQNELAVAGANSVRAIAALSTLKANAVGDHTKDEIKGIMNLVAKSVALMGSASHGVSVKRRKDIKPCLSTQLQSLCAESTPVSENWLFGDDLQYQIRDIQDARRLAHQVARPVNQQHFSRRSPGRGARGRGRGQHYRQEQPFRNQYNSQQAFPNRSGHSRGQSRGQYKPRRGRGHSRGRGSSQ